MPLAVLTDVNVDITECYTTKTVFGLILYIYTVISTVFTLDLNLLLKNYFKCSFVGLECSLQSSDVSHPNELLTVQSL